MKFFTQRYLASVIATQLAVPAGGEISPLAMTSFFIDLDETEPCEKSFKFLAVNNLINDLALDTKACQKV